MLTSLSLALVEKEFPPAGTNSVIPETAYSFLLFTSGWGEQTTMLRSLQ